MSHPNAIAATIAGAITTATVWILGRYHVSITPELSATITTTAAAVLLFIGRRGVKGALQSVWNGAGAAWNGSSDEPTKKT